MIPEAISAMEEREAILDHMFSLKVWRIPSKVM